MKRLNLVNCHELAKSFNGKFLSTNYIKSNTKYEWQCALGHLFKMTYSHVKRKHWCAFCYGNNKHSIEDCRKFAESKNGKCLSLTYNNNKTNLLWECNQGHTWKASFRNVFIKNQWCPKCSINKSKKTFQNNYGVDNPSKAESVKNKKIQTSLKKYGTYHPLQNKEIASKNARSSNYSCILFHWKTNEEIICVGSYEKAVVEYLNKNKIDFLWQPKVFQTPLKTPTGLNSTYLPDIFIIKENLWIEIKGYFRKDALEKWEWFHKEYPNSELWNENKLKEMKIL